MLMGDLALNEHRIIEAQLLYEKASDLLAEFNSAKRKAILQTRINRGMAETALSRKDWVGAQKYLEAWFSFDPKSTTAIELLANCLFEQKNATGSLEKLKEAAKINPELTTPEAILAQYFERAGDRENAKKWMVAALTEGPNRPRGRIWWQVTGPCKPDRLHDVQTQAAAALQIDPTSLERKILRGIVAVFQKDYTTAERYFELARLQSPRSFIAGNDLALALIEQEDKTKQLRALEYAENNVQLNQGRPRPPRPMDGCFSNWAGSTMPRSGCKPRSPRVRSVPIRLTTTLRWRKLETRRGGQAVA